MAYEKLERVAMSTGCHTADHLETYTSFNLTIPP